MKKYLFIFASFLFLTSCSEAQENTGKTIKKVISATEFKKKLALEDAQLIDVRTEGEYSAGNIENAQNIDFYQADFKERLNKLDKSKPVLIYCASGGRSGKAANILKSKGFEVVYDLQGGYSSWPYK